MSFIDDVIRRSRFCDLREEDEANLKNAIEDSSNTILYTYDTVFQMEHSYHPLGTMVYVSETNMVYVYTGGDRYTSGGWESIGIKQNYDIKGI